MNKVITGRDTNFEFKSWAEMVEFCRHATPYKRGSPSLNGSPLFTMTPSYDAALEMAITGWPEMAQKAAIMARPYYRKLSNLIERPNFRYGIEGRGISMGRYNQGIPECRIKIMPTINEGKSNKILTMIVNVGALGNVRAETMALKGGYALAIIDLLELAGYRIQVKLLSIARWNDTRISVLTTAKEPDQNPDKNRLAFCIAHPSVLRRLIFRIRETTWPKTCGMGSTLEYTPNDGEIYIPSGNYFDGMSKDDIESKIITVLEEHGITNTLKK